MATNERTMKIFIYIYMYKYIQWNKTITNIYIVGVRIAKKEFET